MNKWKDVTKREGSLKIEHSVNVGKAKYIRISAYDGENADIRVRFPTSLPGGGNDASFSPAGYYYTTMDTTEILKNPEKYDIKFVFYNSKTEKIALQVETKKGDIVNQNGNMQILYEIEKDNIKIIDKDTLMDFENNYYGKVFIRLSNVEPTISGKDEDLGNISDEISKTYTVFDEDDDKLSIVERLNGKILSTYKDVTSGTTKTLKIPKDKIYELPLNSKNTIEIEVSDGQETAIRKWTFTRVNSKPTISGSDKDLGTINKEIKHSYTVNDSDGDLLTITEKLNGDKINTYSNVKPGSSKTLTITSKEIDKLKVNSRNKITIEVNDSKETTIRTLTFTKGNNLPEISGKNESIGEKDNPFSYSYIVKDNDLNDIYNITEKIDGKAFNHITNQTGENEYILEITNSIFEDLVNNREYTITIEVENNGDIVKREIKFKKVPYILKEGEKVVQLQDQHGNKLFPIIKPGHQNLGAIVSDTPPKAKDGRIYYNSKDKLFYVARGGMWDRLYVAGDEKLEQKAPEKAPELESKTDTTVRLKEQENMEYRYQGGAWQESTYFSNLQRNESYLFEQRFKADEVYKESDPSPALTVRTDKGTQNAPSKPTISNLDYDRATVSGESGTEVKLNSGTWHSSPHTFTGLDEETKYTAYARRKETNTHKASPASSGTTFTTPSAVKIYGVVIDEDNANPNTRVSYIEESVGFSPVRGNNGNTDWGSWKNTWVYDAFKPCLVKNGDVNYYLDKDDFTKKADGGNAILTGADGDVMMEIDKTWLKINKVGSKIYVRIANNKVDDFKCLAHTNGDKEVDKIYVGVYLGCDQNGKLRSISGVMPTGDKAIGSFRDLAESNGDRYHQVPFYPLVLLQSIMVTLLKSTDTQIALGEGYVNANSFAKTGYTNSKGMIYGTKSDTEQMCFMGIEDFWGNKRWWVDGCKYDGGKIKTATTKFNNNASGYRIVGNYPETGGGYIRKVKGDTECGFIPADMSGSSRTYYCDFGYVYDGRFPYFGGIHSDGSYAGGFYLYSNSASTSYSALGSRLFMYGK